MNNTQVKSPLSSAYVSIGAFLLTVVTSLSLVPLGSSDDGTVRYINDIINERGPIPYMLLWTQYSLFLSTLVAKKRNSYPPEYRVQFKIRMITLPIFGIMGTLLGMGAACSGWWAFVKKQTDVNEIKESVSGVLSGFGTAIDVGLLSLLLTIISLNIYVVIVEKTTTRSNQATQRTQNPQTEI